MVVALVISNLEFGGAERQLVELAKGLSALGAEVHVVSLSPYIPLASHLETASVSVHVVERRHKYDLSVVLRLARLFERVRPDVVHAFLFDAQIVGRIAGWWAKVPVIIDSERNANYSLATVKRLLFRVTSFASNACIANSSSGAEFNARILSRRRSEYRVVYNGVDTTRFRPRDRQAARAAVGVPPEAFCLGLFGSFKPQKNQLMLFSIARQLLDERPETFFLVVGDSLHEGRRDSGSYKQRVTALIDELGLRPRCLFLGNREDIEMLYSACDVTVLPSLHEGTPNVALESMACGVPVVVTDVSDNRIVVPDGEVGFVVPLDRPDLLARRVTELGNDPVKRRRMGAAARAWVEERFSCDHLARNTADVYRELLLAARR